MSNRRRSSIPPLAAAALCALLQGCALLRSGPAVYEPVRRASGLTVQELVVPDGPRALRGDVVTVHYHATLPDGSVLDSTVERGQPITFRLGAGEAPPVLDEGVVGMAQFGRRRLTCPPSLVFADDLPPDLPAETPLALEVELLDLQRADG